MLTTKPQDVQDNLINHPKSRRISFPFMGLPVELRLHIYSYLMPNTNINTCQEFVKSTVFPGTFYSYWPIQLRHDCEPCCPALLRTNQKIYHEMVELWYSSTLYWISFRNDEFRFLNREFPATVDLQSVGLPYGFRFLTKLGLSIRLEMKRRVLDRINELADYFSPSGPGNLRDLQLSVSYRFLFLRNLINAADLRAIIHERLDCHLGSLQKIRASRSVRTTFSPERHLGTYPYHAGNQPSAEKLRDDIFAVTTEYFNALEKEISGTSD
jgi:hypothetical protein